MIDEDEDILAMLDAALRDTGTADDGVKRGTLSSRAADEADESEMTSVMGPEERRLLQHATRRGSDAAPPVVREEAFARPTARPPSSGNEQPAIVAFGPTAPQVDVPGETTSDDGSAREGTLGPLVHEPSRYPSQHARNWSIVAFLLLAAAVLYAVQR